MKPELRQEEWLTEKRRGDRNINTSDDFFDACNKYDIEDKNGFLDYVFINDRWGDARNDIWATYQDYLNDQGEFNLERETRNFDHHKYVKSKFNRIGCAFKGYYDIVPLRLVNEELNMDIEIMSNKNCVGELWQRLKKEYPKYTIGDKVPKGPKNNPFIFNSKFHNKYFNKSLQIIELNPISGRYHMDRKSTVTYEVTEPILDNEPVIYYCAVAVGYYHCCLSRNGMFKGKFDITTSLDVNRLNIVYDNLYKDVDQGLYRNPTNSIICYDMECDNVTGDYHYPILITAMEIKFDRTDFSKDNIVNKVQLFKGINCVDQFIEWVLLETDTRIVYAHNGGGYDNLLLLKEKLLKFHSCCEGGGRYKELVVSSPKYDSKDHISFRDSLSFFPMSLREMNNACNNKYYKKLDDCGVDIKKVNMKSLDDSQFIKYAIHDTLALAESLFNIEPVYREFGQSLTTSITLPSLGLKIWKNLSPNNCKLLKIPISKKVERFINDSKYGGRVLHFHRRVQEKLICLDVNSEYPAGMWKFQFPTGPHRVLSKAELEPLVEDCELIHSFIADHPLSILECDIDGNNYMHPIVPYRTPEGCIIYPAGKFSGVYTSVDLIEAIRFGYKVTKINQGITWNDSAYIFKEFIDLIYKLRLKSQADKSPLERVYKLLMNSLFGKFLQKTTYDISFSDKIKGNIVYQHDLPNGQTLTKKNIFTTCKLPNYIGSFILSYGRKILNTILDYIDPGDIKYSDTDSVYISQTIYEQLLVKAPHLFGNELGQFKNDYGDNMFITDAIFADLKRYWLKFNTYKICGKCNQPQRQPNSPKLIKCSESCIVNKHVVKCKFNGLKVNKNHNLPLNKKQFIKLVNGGVIDFVQEVWRRNLFGDIRVIPTKLKFNIDPNVRRTWHTNNLSNPIGYDYTLPPTPFTVHDINVKTLDDELCEIYIDKNGCYHPSRIFSSTTPKRLPKNVNNWNMYISADNSVIFKKLTHKNKQYILHQNCYGTTYIEPDTGQFYNAKPVIALRSSEIPNTIIIDTNTVKQLHVDVMNSHVRLLNINPINITQYEYYDRETIENIIKEKQVDKDTIKLLQNLLHVLLPDNTIAVNYNYTRSIHQHFKGMLLASTPFTKRNGQYLSKGLYQFMNYKLRKLITQFEYQPIQMVNAGMTILYGLITQISSYKPKYLKHFVNRFHNICKLFTISEFKPLTDVNELLSNPQFVPTGPGVYIKYVKQINKELSKISEILSTHFPKEFAKYRKTNPTNSVRSFTKLIIDSLQNDILHEILNYIKTTNSQTTLNYPILFDGILYKTDNLITHLKSLNLTFEQYITNIQQHIADTLYINIKLKFPDTWSNDIPPEHDDSNYEFMP